VFFVIIIHMNFKGINPLEIDLNSEKYERLSTNDKLKLHEIAKQLRQNGGKSSGSGGFFGSIGTKGSQGGARSVKGILNERNETTSDYNEADDWNNKQSLKKDFNEMKDERGNRRVY